MPFQFQHPVHSFSHSGQYDDASCKYPWAIVCWWSPEKMMTPQLTSRPPQHSNNNLFNFSVPLTICSNVASSWETSKRVKDTAEQLSEKKLAQNMAKTVGNYLNKCGRRRRWGWWRRSAVRGSSSSQSKSLCIIIVIIFLVHLLRSPHPLLLLFNLNRERWRDVGITY